MPTDICSGKFLGALWAHEVELLGILVVIGSVLLCCLIMQASRFSVMKIWRYEGQRVVSVSADLIAFPVNVRSARVAPRKVRKLVFPARRAKAKQSEQED
jgi:hypothetical protein